MSKTVLLDAGPLGMISNPNATGVNRECYEWMEALVVNGLQVRPVSSSAALGSAVLAVYLSTQ